MSGRPPTRAVVAGRIAAACFVLLPLGGASAQDAPAVRAAMRLAAEGRGDSARQLLDAEFARARPGDAEYVEVLFWRARLRASADSSERDLRRVAIEFSTSKWADDALLQLAQLAIAAGNPASALALAARLRGDYPDSDLRAQAALWAGRAAFDLGQTRAACALLDSARSEGAADVEFVNRVAFFQSRCVGLAVQPPPESARAPAAAALDSAARRAVAESTATPRENRPFEVQVAAARTDAAARLVAEQLTRAGYGVRVVTGADGYWRVRVGPFATAEAADAAIGPLRRLLGGSPFVVRSP